MIKVLHIITELGLGGAPTMLCRLLSKMDSASFENEVISLTNLGGNAAKIRGAGVPVRALGMKSSIPNPFPAARLFQWIRKSKPHVVQTWMYHANLLGGLAAHLAGNIPVVWGIHHVDLSRQGNKLRTIWTAKGCARISRWLPRCVVFCSQSALLSHMKLGYAAKRMEVIPNGLDVHEFKADPSARLSVREELGIGAEVIVIGMAARFHPLKDHRNFIKAATRLRAMIPEVHFVLCGIDVNYQNPELSKWIREAGVGGHCHLLGARQDMPRLFAAMDIATSSSSSEAFPLAVGEAMACAVPCVVTDVGDCALIVGETGRVVASRDPDRLAEAWRELIEAGPAVRRHMGTAARRRVQRHFALPAIAQRYEAIYAQLADKTQHSIPCRDLPHQLSRI